MNQQVMFTPVDMAQPVPMQQIQMQPVPPDQMQFPHQIYPNTNGVMMTTGPLMNMQQFATNVQFNDQNNQFADNPGFYNMNMGIPNHMSIQAQHNVQPLAHNIKQSYPWAKPPHKLPPFVMQHPDPQYEPELTTNVIPKFGPSIKIDDRYNNPKIRIKNNTQRLSNGPFGSHIPTFDCISLSIEEIKQRHEHPERYRSKPLERFRKFKPGYNKEEEKMFQEKLKKIRLNDPYNEDINNNEEDTATENSINNSQDNNNNNNTTNNNNNNNSDDDNINIKIEQNNDIYPKITSFNDDNNNSNDTKIESINVLPPMNGYMNNMMIPPPLPPYSKEDIDIAMMNNMMSTIPPPLYGNPISMVPMISNNMTTMNNNIINNNKLTSIPKVRQNSKKQKKMKKSKNDKTKSLSNNIYFNNINNFNIKTGYGTNEDTSDVTANNSINNNKRRHHSSGNIDKEYDDELEEEDAFVYSQKCHICHIPFCNYKKHCRHLREHYKDNKPKGKNKIINGNINNINYNTRNGKIERVWLTCEFCQHKASHASNFFTHLLTHGTNKGFICKLTDGDKAVCNKSCSTKQNIIKHIQNSHNINVIKKGKAKFRNYSKSKSKNRLSLNKSKKLSNKNNKNNSNNNINYFGRLVSNNSFSSNNSISDSFSNSPRKTNKRKYPMTNDTNTLPSSKKQKLNNYQ